MSGFPGDSLRYRPFGWRVPRGKEVPNNHIVELGMVPAKITRWVLTGGDDGIVVRHLAAVEIALGIGQPLALKSLDMDVVVALTAEVVECFR